MQVGPMRRDLQPTDLGGGQGVFVGLGSGQGAGSVQPHQVIFEHAFNILFTADVPGRLDTLHGNGQHITNPDNTSRSELDIKLHHVFRSI